jgi:photosystem II stability/assembly factor-like uncharacterized protein
MLRRSGRFSLLVLLSMVLAAGVAGAQGFHAVSTQDGMGVWAVGDGGVAYFSGDGGFSYSSQTIAAVTLRGVAAKGLTVVAVGDAGKVVRSANGGGTWSTVTLPGTPGIRAVTMASPTVGWLAGAAGTIQKTTDGGATWSPQTSGVGVTLNAIRFVDASTGWAAGDGGTVLATTDGGASWATVAVPTSNRLLAIDAFGARVWITGDGGTCLKSTNGGASWTHVNLKLDTRSDVRAVRVAANDTVYVGGGGGFVRRSVNDGATWTFLQHSMHARLTGLAVHGSRLFMCRDRNRVVFWSANTGGTWFMPSGATHAKAWVHKVLNLGPTRGGTIAQHPANPHSFWAVSGDKVLKSVNEGETWAVIDTIVALAGPTMNRSNAFIVSPKDSNAWLVATRTTSGTTGRIMRTTDAGANWSTPLIKDFSEYGIPLEMNPDQPDTVYYGVNFDGLFRSTDFGASWHEVSMDSSFRSPCDIVAVPDSAHIILLGDGITGIVNPPAQYYRSTDGGVTFTLVHSRTGFPGASEVPGMACSRLAPERTLGTNWYQGGVQRSTDFGQTWPTVAGQDQQLWGIDITRDDPNVITLGLYSPGGWFLSTDGGLNWNVGPVPPGSSPPYGSNYSFYHRDRELMLAEQQNGIWKLNSSYAYTPGNTQSLSLNVPNGGEEWSGGSTRTISWNHQNVGAVRLEYRISAADPWQLIAEVPGYQGTYAWTVPNVSTYEASVRVSELGDGTPSDESDIEFTILVPLAAPDPASLDFDVQVKHTAVTLPITIENAGTGPLAITSVTTTGGGAFTEGRNAFGIPAGASDTIGVTFRPRGAASYAGTLEITSNASGTPVISIPLAGIGASAYFAAAPDPVLFDLVNPGATAKDTVRFYNPGNIALSISSIVSSHPEFFVSRTSLVVPAGGSDTVRVFYHPLGAGLDSTTFTVTASDTAAAHAFKAVGEARDNVSTETTTGPAAFALFQNQPNPFGGVTRIRYALPVAADVTLEVFDLGGQRVATLVREWQEAGVHTAAFGANARGANGRRLEGLSSGVYFYRFSAGGFTSTRKMLYIQ